MRRTDRWFRTILVFAILLIPITSNAADRTFDRIVSRLATHYGKRPTLDSGFMNLMASCFAPSGVGHLKMAVFDELDAAKNPLGTDFDAFMKDAVDPEFKPLVKIRSNKDGDRVYVFSRERGNDVELLILSAEPTEAVVLKMRLNSEAMGKWLQEPVAMARSQEHGNAKESEADSSKVSSASE